MPAKKRRVEFTWRAEREYLAELRYLLLQEASAAFAVQDRIEAALERLARYPRMARSIQVLRVLHQRRKYP